MFHCNHGRTKAGLLSILILGFLGVSDKDIENSYNTTYNIISKNVKNLSKFRDIPTNVYEVIANIKTHYISINKYLIDFCNISEVTLNEIKRTIALK